jgi:hypothetical protein
MLKPKEKPHYVKNADFSQAVVEYVKKQTNMLNVANLNRWCPTTSRNAF